MKETTIDENYFLTHPQGVVMYWRMYKKSAAKYIVMILMRIDGGPGWTLRKTQGKSEHRWLAMRSLRRMVEQIGLYWNTLIPHIAELAQAGQEKAMIRESSRKQTTRVNAAVVPNRIGIKAGYLPSHEVTSAL